MHNENQTPGSFGCPDPRIAKMRQFYEHHGRRGPWGPMPFGPGGPFGGGPRARRGDVRIAILALLAEEPMHGYQVIQELGERSGGMWRPSPGSVYPTLQMLEDEGLISAAEVDGKRVFSLTEAGTAAVAERTDGRPPWEQMGAASDESADMRKAGMSLIQAAWQAGQTANAEQQVRITAVLNEARKLIYGILAEDA
jgi:DNA-binding PadR family transcriptional regulator